MMALNRAHFIPSVCRSVFLGGLLAAAMTNSVQAKAPVMQLPGSVSVTNTGQASYSIPIDVPPGTAGLVPALSLNYSSGSGNGLLGVGWSLSGLSAITRCPPTMVQDGTSFSSGVTFTASDDFCYRGQKLVLVAGSYGGDGSLYRTELESFTKIQLHSTSTTPSSGTTSPGFWWEAWTKSGQHLEFGATSDSEKLQTSVNTSGFTPQIAAWAVDRIMDLHGNYITVTYSNDANTGELDPLEIDYTGSTASPAIAPYNSIRFGYNFQPVTMYNYVAGSTSAVNKLMNAIAIRINGTGGSGTIVNNYTLNYVNTAVSGVETLQSIQKCDGTNNCLPATTFQYNPENFNVAVSPTSGAGVLPQDAHMPYNILADFAGNGTQSILVNTSGYPPPAPNAASEILFGTAFNLYLNKGNGTFSSEIRLNAPSGPPPGLFNAHQIAL